MSVISRLFKSVVAVAMIAGVIAVAVVLFMAVTSTVDGLKAQSGESVPAAQPVIFEIAAGETADDIVKKLRDQEIIDNSTLFSLKLKTSGRAGDIKAGRFQLTPGMDWDKLIDTITTSPLEIGLRFTVIEGSRLEEIAEKLSSEGIVDKDTFLLKTATQEGAAAIESDLLAASGKPPEQGLEGYLFPDTYEIKQNAGDNSDAVIEIMFRNMEEKVTPEIREVLAERGRTVHQMLTVASIIQREAVVKDELPAMAAVFWNRVDQGMHLGADPTTQYALGKQEGSTSWWPHLDEIGVNPNDVDDAYNTYRVIGLPPGPICSSGAEAIEAAARPAQTAYLYFVLKNDGTGQHAFAETLEEHERNRVIYGNR